ncbi:MAG: 23S rRNA (adenine(1618)-N(6))-methyltransferase RlmF [Oceanicoccus sp.]
MNSPTAKQQIDKGLHPRNPHRQRYNFELLQKALPELSAAVRENSHGDLSIDFSNPQSVKLLNRALLKYFYQVDYWDIPADYLCPPIPGRADYLHYLADILAESYVQRDNSDPADTVPVGKRVTALDIGMGANCVYPIIGTRQYGWSFIGSDIDPLAVKSAALLGASNPTLKGRIDCRLQANPQKIFSGVLDAQERVDATLCNPPFHRSLAEAAEGSSRKINNLAVNSAKRSQRARTQRQFSRDKPKLNSNPSLNFGGQAAELWCPGGELAFVTQMIKESAEVAGQCLWFTSLVSKKENLGAIYRSLKSVQVDTIKTIDMQHGQKMTRIVAWTFHNEESRRQWWL